jgi:hypothetical protein
VSRLRLVLVLDWVIVALAVLAVVIDTTGGFDTAFAGIRLSAHQTDRAVLAAIAVWLVRWRTGRGIPPLGGRLAWVGAVRDRLFDRAADPEPPLVRRSGRPRHLGFATAGLLAIGAVLLHTQLAQMTAVPDLGDPLFSMWRMGWVFQQLGGDPRPLFDANIFHPEPLTLTYSDSMLLPAAIGAPLLAIGISPVVAYNLLFLSGFLLSGITTYVLIEGLVGSPRPAFVGALIYAFYPYRFEHYSHLELQMTYWMPLGLLALHRLWQTWRMRYAIALALCGVAELYSSMYYGVFFPLYAAAILGTLIFVSRPEWRRMAPPLVAGGLIAVVLSIPLARPYYAAAAVKGERDIPTVTYYSAGASDYFRAHPRSALYGGRLLADEYPERALFPGVAALALSAVALAPPLGVTRLAYLAGLVAAFDLSRGLKGRTYGYLYDWFAPIRGMRVPARVSAILAISLAVLAGFGARRLMARQRSGRGSAIAFAALVALVAIDLHPALELVRVWPGPPPIYSGLAGDRAVVLAEIPFTTKVPGITDNIPYLYFSLWHWRPMINGYSGFTTPAYQQLLADMADFPGPRATAAMRAHGVTHVSVNCFFIVQGCPQMLDALDGRPDFHAIASGRWQGSPVRLFTFGP